VGGPEGFQVGGQGGLAGGVEAAEGDLGGAEVFAEEVDGAGGRHGHVEVDGDEFGADAGEVGGEALADDGVVSPEDGRWDAGWRRGVLAADFEHEAGEAGGVPVGHGEQAAGFEDAGALGGDELGARGEHGAEHGGDGVEGGVGVGKLLGVAFVEGDGEGFGGGALAGLDEEVWGDVDAGDEAGFSVGERACEWDGGVAGAAGDVEDAGAGGDVEAGDEGFGAAGDGAGDDAEVAGHPSGAHGVFYLLDGDLLDGWGGRAHGRSPGEAVSKDA
jgi:hypothetical protein